MAASVVGTLVGMDPLGEPLDGTCAFRLMPSDELTDAPPVEASPYDVMVARWEPRD